MTIYASMSTMIASNRASDPTLTRYLASLSAYPVLERDEEHDLAVRYAGGDAAAGQRLITANLRLVVKLAREYDKAHNNLLDLIQEGNVGLTRSLPKYDPHRGIRFSTYAAWWIRAYILKYILDNVRLVRFGKTEAQRKLFFNLRTQKRALEARGITPTPEAVAKALKVAPEAVVAMEQRLGQSELSLDAPLGDDGERTHLDALEAPVGERPDVLSERRELRVKLRASLDAFGAGLRGRDKAIFEERLVAEEPQTLDQLGRRFGISRERTRQVERQLVTRLKGFLGRRLGDAVPAANDSARLAA